MATSHGTPGSNDVSAVSLHDNVANLFLCTLGEFDKRPPSRAAQNHSPDPARTDLAARLRFHVPPSAEKSLQLPI